MPATAEPLPHSRGTARVVIRHSRLRDLVGSPAKSREKKSKNNVDTFSRVQVKTGLHFWNRGKLTIREKTGKREIALIRPRASRRRPAINPHSSHEKEI